MRLRSSPLTFTETASLLVRTHNPQVRWHIPTYVPQEFVARDNFYRKNFLPKSWGIKYNSQILVAGRTICT